jgi:hypothetical protein
MGQKYPLPHTLRRDAVPSSDSVMSSKRLPLANPITEHKARKRTTNKVSLLARDLISRFRSTGCFFRTSFHYYQIVFTMVEQVGDGGCDDTCLLVADFDEVF